MMQSKKIAITGGIGSGKTTLCNILREEGYPVFSCDEIVGQLWRESAFLRTLAERFPQDCTDGAIDKKKLSAHVFSDEAALKALDALTHPLVMQRLTAAMSAAEVCFAEVPLLFEGGYEGLFDGVIALFRAEEARIAAVCARDGVSEGEVFARMKRQMNASDLSGKPCYIVVNDGTVDDLRRGAEGALRHFGIG